MSLWCVTAHLRDTKTGKLLCAEQFVYTPLGIEKRQQSVAMDWAPLFHGTEISLDPEYYESYHVRAATNEEWALWDDKYMAALSFDWLEKDLTQCNN